MVDWAPEYELDPLHVLEPGIFKSMVYLVPEALELRVEYGGKLLVEDDPNSGER